MKKLITTKMLPKRRYFNALHGICMMLMLLAFGKGNAQYTAIPDSNFEDALSAYDDYPNDYQVPTANISGLTSLDVHYSNISDLTGIQDFVSLTFLDCSTNNLSSLNTSTLTSLTELICYDNDITAINLANNTALVELRCYLNEIDAIDLTGLVDLEYLDCRHNNVDDIDLSEAPSLKHLNIAENDLITLDLTGVNLEYLDITYDMIGSLDLSGQTNLLTLYIPFTAMGSLDLTYNTGLKKLAFDYCSIDPVDISGLTDLEELSCNGTGVTSIDVSNQPNLKFFSCGDNNLSSLDLSDNPLLESFYCFNTSLTSLDFSDNPLLQRLECTDSLLTSLDFTYNPNLAYLTCHNNPITTINLSGTTDLMAIDCSYTDITILNLLGQTYLYSLNATNNPGLTCIVVDNPTSAASETYFFKDAGATYWGSPCLPTQVQTSQCGATLAALNTYVYADAVTGATNYHFQITDGTNTWNVNASDGRFRISALTSPSGLYSTTYAVKVQAYVGGSWEIYGASCNVTTPAPPPTTLSTGNCGRTIYDLGVNIQCAQIAGVTSYKFKISDGTTDHEIENPTNSHQFKLTQFSTPFLGYGKTYTVWVKTKANGTYSSYGSPCYIYTHTVSPLSEIKAVHCGSTLASTTTKIYAEYIDAVEAYVYRITWSGGTEDIPVTAPTQYVQLNWLTGGVLNSTVYTICVATKVNGTIGAFGDCCNVTTPAPRPGHTEPIVSVNPKINGYPNPFSNTFALHYDINAETAVEVKVFDLNGRLLDAMKLKAGDLDNLALGGQYMRGMYNVVVTNGDEVKSAIMIKK